MHADNMRRSNLPVSIIQNDSTINNYGGERIKRHERKILKISWLCRLTIADFRVVKESGSALKLGLILLNNNATRNVTTPAKI